MALLAQEKLSWLRRCADVCPMYISTTRKMWDSSCDKTFLILYALGKIFRMIFYGDGSMLAYWSGWQPMPVGWWSP